MNIDAETGRKIQELQVLEHNLQALLMQKQAMQSEANEILTALEEIKKTKDEIYKIVGGIMLKSEKQAIEKELGEKKKIIDLRMSSIEKQEKIFEEKSEKLRKEVSEKLSNKKE
jgi:prefoldin beta subunit